jgi:hypothetical protein
MILEDVSNSLGVVGCTATHNTREVRSYCNAIATWKRSSGARK